MEPAGPRVLGHVLPVLGLPQVAGHQPTNCEDEGLQRPQPWGDGRPLSWPRMVQAPALRTQSGGRDGPAGRGLPCILTDILDGIGRMFLLHKRHGPGRDSCAPSRAAGHAGNPHPCFLLWDNVVGPKGLQGRVWRLLPGPPEVSSTGMGIPLSSPPELCSLPGSADPLGHCPLTQAGVLHAWTPCSLVETRWCVRS